MKELVNIQGKLKAPKGHFNRFGKYYYRSAEDILEAVKPLLTENNCILLLSDSVEAIGDYAYVKATAKIVNSEGLSLEVSAYAREAKTQAGMADAQITGSSSSYARKYALNGLLAIDDNKDPDDDNKDPDDSVHTERANAQAVKAKTTPAPKAKSKPAPKAAQPEIDITPVLEQIAKAKTKDELMKIYDTNKHIQTSNAFKSALTKRKKELS